MTHILRPLSLGRLLDETFDIYRHNFLLFLGISAIPNVVLLLMKLALGNRSVARSGPELFIVLTLLLSSIGTLFVSSIVTAATTFAVSDIYLDSPTTIRSCFSRVNGKAWRVVYVSFIVGLIVGFGMLLCLVPGIYFAGMYGVAIPAAVLEKISGNQALGRSTELTRDSVGRVIVVYFLTAIFAITVAAGLNAGVEALGSHLLYSGTFSKMALSEVIASLATIVFGPISAIGLTLTYYDLRVRKEAFDIQHMMSQLSATREMAAGATPQ
ncbi:MAG TPA: hypothetical protein VN669_13555 [Candidatus Acidoferrales bacterium]|nr:hypothetical protein [Candidatus Acidoferrales bacterium]